MNIDDYLIPAEVKLKDCLSLSTGLFSYIGFELPDIFNISNSNMDLLFLSNYALRTAAPILNLIHTDTTSSDTLLTVEELTQLGSIILNTFQNKWNRMMEIAQLDYDPIHNYLDTLTENISGSESNSSESTTNYGSINTRTDNLTKNESLTHNTVDTTTYNSNNTLTSTGSKANSNTGTIGDSGTSENNIYGFNSSSAVGDSTYSNTNTTTNNITLNETRSDSDANVKSGSDSIAKTGTDTKTVTDTGTQANAKSGTDSTDIEGSKTQARTRTYTKSGNIGNLTYQQLISSDLDLWKFNFINSILHDVAEFISLPIYC